MRDYFGFREIISTFLIKLIYILGFIVMTIGGITAIIVGGQRTLMGFGALIMENLLWRILCEGRILAFSVHDIFVSVNKTLKEEYTQDIITRLHSFH